MRATDEFWTFACHLWWLKSSKKLIKHSTKAIQTHGCHSFFASIYRCRWPKQYPFGTGKECRKTLSAFDLQLLPGCTWWFHFTLTWFFFFFFFFLNIRHPLPSCLHFLLDRIQHLDAAATVKWSLNYQC